MTQAQVPDDAAATALDEGGSCCANVHDGASTTIHSEDDKSSSAQISAVPQKRSSLARELTKLAIYCLGFYILVGCAIKFTPLYEMVVLRPEKRNALYDQQISGKEEISFTNPKGDVLNAWFFRAPKSKKVAIVFHGNAGNVTHRLLIAKDFLMQGVSVFLFDYRGYGTSEGKPSIPGLVEDGERAYSYVRDNLGYTPENIILYGESIGTAVASRVAQNNQYSRLILQSGLTSLPDVACDGVAWLKLYPTWVFPQPHFDTKNIIASLKGPILVMHGGNDKLIPVHHGHDLFALASEPKQLVIIPNAGHNDMLSADEKLYVDSLSNFLAEPHP